MFRFARLLPALRGPGLQQSLARNFAAAATEAEAAAPKPTKGSGLTWFLGLSAVGAAGAWYANDQGYFNFGAAAPAVEDAVKIDYDEVKKAVADVLEADYEDGSYGPILVRLAWHSSGSYDKATNTGGSNGALMRFPPEAGYGANAGLEVARDVLEPIKKRFPWCSYADLYTLAGATAIEEMGGPKIEWKPGRTDMDNGQNAPPDGRLPDAAQGAAHLRTIFYRMGFDDREIAALSGAHALGRCHTDRSGFLGPWTFSPTTFSNQYFVLLRDEKWNKKKWNGPLQYEDKTTGQLMMLPTDMALVWDRKFKPWALKYAEDEELFFKDFAAAFSKLLELGVPRDAPAAATPVQKA